jgi:hypothetical protein
VTKECGKKGFLALLKVLFGHSLGKMEDRQQNLYSNLVVCPPDTTVQVYLLCLIFIPTTMTCSYVWISFYIPRFTSSITQYNSVIHHYLYAYLKQNHFIIIGVNVIPSLTFVCSPKCYFLDIYMKDAIIY